MGDDDNRRKAEETLPDRPALYYPRIHFRDLEWLKGTLLAFGSVHRIVPDDHPLDRDSEAVRAVSARHGAVKPLIFELSPDLMSIERAQNVLWTKLQAVTAGLQVRFGEVATADAEKRHGRYEIFRSKIHDGMLEFLLQNQLAWPSFDQTARGEWIRVHPELGEAIMGVSAIAAATSKGLDVVTDSTELHTALAAHDANAFLRHVLDPDSLDDSTIDQAVATDLLTHAVLTTHFDLRQLSMDRICGMIGDGADLRVLRSHLLDYAKRLPGDVDAEERKRRLEQLSQAVRDDWQEVDKRLTPQMRAALKDSAATATESLVEDAAKGFLTTAVTVGLTATVAGVSVVTMGAAVIAGLTVPIGIALVKGLLKSRRGQHDPQFRYLTGVMKQGGTLLTVPRPYASG